MVDNLAQDVAAFTSNVFYVGGDRPALVDAGANFDIVARLEAAGQTPDRLVLTHTHPDHVGNVTSLVDRFESTVYGYDAGHPAVQQELADGAQIQLGDHTYTVMHTPGHALDHCCLYSDTEGALFGGDLVFQNGGFGRTDLDGGDRNQLLASLSRVRETVDELNVIYPGHGPVLNRSPHEQLARAERMARR